MILPNTYKSIFISDIHLGLSITKVNDLILFLKHSSCENIYILGDFFDGWELKSRWRWNLDYTLLIQKLLRKIRKGTKIVYITGNHDDFMKILIGLDFNGICVCDEYVHKNINGDILLIHGHQFDGFLNKIKWIQHLGSKGYNVLIKINFLTNVFRSIFKLPNWSLSKYVKNKIKSAVSYMNNYEIVICDYALKKGFNRIISGHIHQPCKKIINSVEYYNCGDWVENNSCVVEHLDGTLEIITNFQVYEIQNTK